MFTKLIFKKSNIVCIGILSLLRVKTMILLFLMVVIAYDIMCFLRRMDNFEKDRKLFGNVLKIWKKNTCLIAAFLETLHRR